MEPPKGKRVLPALPVDQVRGAAQKKGVSSATVLGNDSLFEFRADGFSKTVQSRVDMETFSPHVILRLVDFFDSRLTKEDFWPEL